MAMLNEASLSPADAHAHANATTPTHSKAAAMASATTMLTTKTPFSIEHILFRSQLRAFGQVREVLISGWDTFFQLSTSMEL